MQGKQLYLKEQCDVRRGSERKFDGGYRVFVNTALGEGVTWEEYNMYQVATSVTYIW